jgi:SAM-dependent methyltransferase
MAHQQQFDFVEAVSRFYPNNFANSKVLEVGSLDINGSVRQFFTGCDYIGIDLGQGRGVDIVCQGQDYDAPDNTFDTVISCECFEHNPDWVATFANMHRMVKPGGLIVMSCATTGRAEHGTRRTSPSDAPFCADYYKNLTEQDFVENFDLDSMFSIYEFGVGEETKDLYFYGVKKLL